MDKIKCPHCGKQVQLSEAIVHELSEQVRSQEKKKLQAQFDEEKAKETAKRERELREEFERQNKQKSQELEELKRKEKLLTEKLAQESEEREKFEIKVKDEAEKQAFEKTKLEKLEYEKKISDMQKALEEAQRKGKQGSQQLQGDVLEIDLKERLKEVFPYDSINDVPTGIRGGDIVHDVMNKFGNKAGTILWETKRQKAWNKAWLVKLREDMRRIEGTDCILVSDILPQDIKIYDRIDGVWVTSYEYAIKLASVLRVGLLNVAIAKSSASHGDEELRKFYQIVTSDKFRHMFEARNEIIELMKKELDADKASTERRWRRQSLYIEKLSSNNRELYGLLEDHIPSLKPLKEIELPKLESGDDEDDNQTLF